MPAATKEATKSTSSRERAIERSEGRVKVPDIAPIRGGVSIAEVVVAKIAAQAAREIPGIYPAGAGGITKAVRTNDAAAAIRARIVRDREVKLEMRMKVDYGEHIPTRGEQVRGVVAEAIRELTDLETSEIKVKITEIIVPAPRQPDGNLSEATVDTGAHRAGGSDPALE